MAILHLEFHINHPLGDTKSAMYLNIAANIVNAFGNWVLIYGNLGFPRMELDGAGIASLNTRIFLGVAMLLYVMYSKKYKEYEDSLSFHSNLRKTVLMTIAILPRIIIKVCHQIWSKK